MAREDLGDAVYWDLVEDAPAECREALGLACYAITHLEEKEIAARSTTPSWRSDGVCLVILLRNANAADLVSHLAGVYYLSLDALHPYDIRHQVHALRAENGSCVVLARNPVVMNCFDNQSRSDLERVFLLDARGQLYPVLALHDEAWLACAKLGTLYDQMVLEMTE